ncbi:hypothetical protein ABZX39_15220 [Streptomyces collinus]|uniref:hypothetical protein n=1 Tax=Streptomyces collinus TaxID=42684 RepID=UPI0033BF8812
MTDHHAAPFRRPFTHGPALCLTARLLRSSNPQPLGAVFASFPDWAHEHPLTRDDLALSELISRTAILIYCLAVTPYRRPRGIARTLLMRRRRRPTAPDTGWRP